MLHNYSKIKSLILLLTGVIGSNIGALFTACFPSQAVSSANGYKGTTFFRLLQILKLKFVDNLKEFQQIPIPYILMYARKGVEGVMTGGMKNQRCL